MSLDRAFFTLLVVGPIIIAICIACCIRHRRRMQLMQNSFQVIPATSVQAPGAPLMQPYYPPGPVVAGAGSQAGLHYPSAPGMALPGQPWSQGTQYQQQYNSQPPYYSPPPSYPAQQQNVPQHLQPQMPPAPAPLEPPPPYEQSQQQPFRY